MADTADSFDVEGVVLPRPFKIRRLGHFGVDLEDMEAGLRFYVEDIGFRITDALNLANIPRTQPLVEGSPDPHLYFTITHFCSITGRFRTRWASPAAR
jgi:hypothetical protein